MPTVARLRGRRAFSELASQGRSVRSGPVRVRYFVAPSNENTSGKNTSCENTGAAHVGYAIGKRVGGAVERNRIRRRLRAAVAASSTPLTSGFYLISADPSAARAEFDTLVSAIDAVAAKVQA